MFVKTISAWEPLMEEALQARMRHIRAEIAGENPTPPTPRIGWAELEAYRPRAAAPTAANGVENLLAVVIKAAQEHPPRKADS